MPDADFSLDSVSVLLVWTAIAIYALAFIAYAVDLARRSDLAAKAQDAKTRAAAPARALVGAGASASGAGGDVVSVAQLRAEEAAALEAVEARPAARPRYVWARIGTSLTVLGFLFHVGADITRGIAAGRVPWSNMYEFALTGTMLIVAVYLVVLLRYDLRFLGTFITGLVTVLLEHLRMGYRCVFRKIRRRTGDPDLIDGVLDALPGLAWEPGQDDRVAGQGNLFFRNAFP